MKAPAPIKAKNPHNLNMKRALALIMVAASVGSSPSATTNSQSTKTAEPAATAIAAPVLRWEKQTVEADSKIGQKIFRTAYRFSNIGSRPVSILDIKPSCGCVATELDKFDYAPGESGEIKVTFDLGMDDSSRLQSRTILVTESDAPKSPTLLQLLVQVPETVEATPKLVTWERGENAEAKETVVKAGPNIAPVKLTLASTNSDFDVRIATDDPGRSYRVKITPKNTTTPSYAQIELLAESTSFDRPLSCEINVNVK
jgi:hypothetical protein